MISLSEMGEIREPDVILTKKWGHRYVRGVIREAVFSAGKLLTAIDIDVAKNRTVTTFSLFSPSRSLSCAAWPCVSVPQVTSHMHQQGHLQCKHECFAE